MSGWRTWWPIPRYRTQRCPSGFMYIPAAPPGDIHIFNTDAHRNYVGYRFDGSATAIELKNCRGYANRTYGLMDNTAAVTYSYCHFYANNLATGVSTDVTGTPGPIDGGHNLAADTPPYVRGFMRYPARISVTYDDPGLVDGSHQYIQALLPAFQTQWTLRLSIAVVTGYDLSNQLIPTFQSWIDAGWDVNCHSVSHQYFVFPNAFTLHYTGNSGIERDSVDSEQAPDHSGARGRERAGELGLESFRNRSRSQRAGYAGRNHRYVEAAWRVRGDRRSKYEDSGQE